MLVRPSYVLGGRAMQIVADEEGLLRYLRTAVAINEDQPVLVDKYILGKELEVDAVCDGKEVFVPGIMQHIERTGVHSGDSISVYPTFSVSEKVKQTILDYTRRLGLGIGIVGLFNIQFIAVGDEVYVIEVNPRSSRTVPSSPRRQASPSPISRPRSSSGTPLPSRDTPASAHPSASAGMLRRRPSPSPRSAALTPISPPR